MKEIIILGVGRSGTTMLYNVLQKALSDQYRKVKYVYEPFLWRQKVFDKPFTSIKEEFTYISSVSIDGIYNNKKLPLFMDEDSVREHCHNEFLTGLHRAEKTADALLAKYIRANGRYRLLRKISPNAKIVLMLRNPLDLINSSINMFSFYGDDYHESDKHRFLKEAEFYFPDEFNPAEFLSSVIYREGMYWYLMTKKLLRDAESDTNTYTIPYEVFSQDKVFWFKKICGFVGIEYRSEYDLELNNKVGPIRSLTINLSNNDYQVLYPLMDKYVLFVESLGFDFDKEKTTRKYEGRLLKKRKYDPLRGRNSAYLLEVLRRSTASKLKDLAKRIVVKK